MTPSLLFRYASYLLEKKMNGASSTPGMGPFVSAFASTNLGYLLYSSFHCIPMNWSDRRLTILCHLIGDVSPNTAGAKCIDTGLPCEKNSSTCGGKCEKCIAFGPGVDMV